MYTCAEQNQPAQVRSSREGVAWNYSKVVLPTMSQLASHYCFHDLKTWLTWWQSIGLVKLYSSEDKWVPNCPVNPNDSRFCSTFPSTWRELASSSPSPPCWRVHWWTTCAAVAQISRHSQKIAMAWRDACENYNIYMCMIIYAGNLAPFLMHLRIILLWSFMLIAGWMRETHHLKYSYESAIIWLWNIETWKKRTVAYKNETQLMNPQFDAIGPPVITCDPKTWLWHAWTTSLRMQLVRNPGDRSPRGDPSGWPGWSQPDPEIVTCHIYTSDSRAVAFILHWMWCQSQFPRHHRSAHCVRNRIIRRKSRKNKRHDQN